MEENRVGVTATILIERYKKVEGKSGQLIEAD